MIEELAVIVTQIGLPAVIVLWFMWRIEPLVKTNNEVLAVVVEHLRRHK